MLLNVKKYENIFKMISNLNLGHQNVHTDQGGGVTVELTHVWQPMKRNLCETVQGHWLHIKLYKICHEH